jgi:acetyl-CoA carboxylase biotin carboxyl carrier protein
MPTDPKGRPKTRKRVPPEPKKASTPDMTIEEIKELLAVFNESGVAELDVQRGDSRVRIKRSSGISQEVLAPAPVHGAAAPQPAAAHTVSAHGIPPPRQSAAEPMSSGRPVVDENCEIVKSPIVGTFYESPSPGSPNFVKVGDHVEVGTVLCIIESMKLMNEIESEVAGTIAARLVENGRPVEYGEALFAVRPR